MVYCRTKGLLALFMAAALLLALFAGCGGDGANRPELTTVRKRSTGEMITIGETRAEVEKVIGPPSGGGFDFLEDNTVGDYYTNEPGLRVDYLDDVVVRVMIERNEDWELMNGLHPGMPKEEAEALYADIEEREVGQSGGILVSYDENMKPIPLDEFAPYVLIVSFTDANVVELAFIDYNF